MNLTQNAIAQDAPAADIAKQIAVCPRPSFYCADGLKPVIYTNSRGCIAVLCVPDCPTCNCVCPNVSAADNKVEPTYELKDGKCRSVCECPSTPRTCCRPKVPVIDPVIDPIIDPVISEPIKEEAAPPTPV